MSSFSLRRSIAKLVAKLLLTQPAETGNILVYVWEHGMVTRQPLYRQGSSLILNHKQATATFKTTGLV